jgi:hypothetical protein
MHERAARDDPSVARRPRTVPASSALVMLQRAIGNRRMAALLRTRTLARSPGGPLAKPEAGSPEAPAAKGRVDLIFIMGDHVNDSFYAGAHQYYKKTYPKAKLITGVRSLEGVIRVAGRSSLPINNLFLVSHGDAEGTMFFKLTEQSQTKELRHETLLDDLSATSALPAANTRVLDEQTTLRVKGCNVGRSTRTLNLLDRAFGGKVTVIAPTHAQLFGKGAPAEALGEYYVAKPGKVRLTEEQILQLFKDKYPWVSESEWRGLQSNIKEEVIEDPIPVNNKPVAPRNSAHTEAWFKTTKDFKSLEAQGYDDAYESKREVKDKKVKIEVTATGPNVKDKKLTLTFDEREDAELIAAADARHGLPGVSEYKVELRARDSIDLSVVARRTVWHVEGKPIKVDGKAVRGGRDQADWYQSSTFK